jgi:ABC-type transporter Mla subunit MlaD
VSDFEKRQKRHNTIVGLFVIIGLSALVWLVFKFGDMPLFVAKYDSFEVYVQFHSAPGVQKDTPVRFCGYQIGRVTRVQAPQVRPDLITGQEYYQTVVVLRIDKEYITIPSNVEVKMMMRGLGSSYIELTQDPEIPPKPLIESDPNTVYLYDGAFLQGTTGMTSEFFPEESQEKLSELIDGISTLVNNFNIIIGDPDNQNNFKTTLDNLTEVSDQAKYTLKEIEKLAAAGTSTLKNSEAKIDEIVMAATETSEHVNQFITTATEVFKNTDERAEDVVAVVITTVEELGKANAQLRLIMEKINKGQGTAAKFINDPRLYESLVDDTAQLEELIKSIKSLIDKIEEKGLGKVW